MKSQDCNHDDRNWSFAGSMLLFMSMVFNLCLAGDGPSFSFYAVYDRLLDSRTQSFTVWDFDLSGDGNTIIVAGNDNIYDNPVLYTLNSDGSNLQNIPLPEEVDEIDCISIDSAGTVAYFFSNPFFYKVEEGTVTPIFNLKEETDYNGIYTAVTNGEGNYVFFAASATYSEGWIHRINSDGTGLERVVYHKDVIRDGGYAGGLGSNFSVNHDGSKIAFVMSGYHDDNSFHYKGELFLKDETGYHQLTNDSEISTKGDPAISGDGNSIVFYSNGAENKWYSIGSDGSGRLPIADHGSNFMGLDVTYNGSLMIHGEGSGIGGCLVATDGSYERDLFSSTYPWNLQFDHLWSDIKMSDDGSKICFLFDANEDGKRTFSLYTGHFNNRFAVPDAPLIEDIKITPPVIPDVPDIQLLLSTRISDPQGVEDIKYLACNELVLGRKKYSDEVPIYFRWEPNDKGEWPDVEAGDGVFRSEGVTKSIVEQFSEAEIRIGVVDNSWTVVIADGQFEIKEIGAPGKVDLISPENNETEMDTALVMRWSGVENAVHYHCQMSMDELFDEIIIENEEISDTSLFVTELNKGTTYFWRIRAFNGVEYGNWSDVYIFTTETAVGIDPARNVHRSNLILPVRPNPVSISESLYFSFPGATSVDIQIYHCTGRLVFRKNMNSPGGELILPAGNIFHAEGIYFYIIRTEEGILSGKTEVLKR